MLIRNAVIRDFIVILALLLAANSGFAQDETVDTAEELMIWQLEAVKKGDYQRFIKHGNKAFKELMHEYFFDTFKRRSGKKIARGYRLEYLGSIRRIGMREHLWKVHITGDKYELLGSLTLANDKVVGFNID